MLSGLSSLCVSQCLCCGCVCVCLTPTERSASTTLCLPCIACSFVCSFFIMCCLLFTSLLSPLLMFVLLFYCCTMVWLLYCPVCLFGLLLLWACVVRSTHDHLYDLICCGFLLFSPLLRGFCRFVIFVIFVLYPRFCSDQTLSVSDECA